MLVKAVSAGVRIYSIGEATSAMSMSVAALRKCLDESSPDS